MEKLLLSQFENCSVYFNVVKSFSLVYEFHVIKFYCNPSTCEDVVEQQKEQTLFYSQQQTTFMSSKSFFVRKTSIDFLHPLSAPFGSYVRAAAAEFENGEN